MYAHVPAAEESKDTEPVTWCHPFSKHSYCVSVASCVWLRARAVPATGAGLKTQGLIYPGATNWADWDPGAAAGQAECLRSAAGKTHLAHTDLYISH